MPHYAIERCSPLCRHCGIDLPRPTLMWGDVELWTNPALLVDRVVTIQCSCGQSNRAVFFITQPLERIG